MGKGKIGGDGNPTECWLTYWEEIENLGSSIDILGNVCSISHPIMYECKIYDGKTQDERCTIIKMNVERLRN